MVSCISDKQATVKAHSNTHSTMELGRDSRPTIATIARSAVSGNRRDDSIRIYLTDTVAFCNVKTTVGTYRNIPRSVNASLSRWPIIVIANSRPSISCHGGDYSIRTDLPDAIVIGIRNVEIAIGTYGSLRRSP
jgi:hypothetical protein